MESLSLSGIQLAQRHQDDLRNSITQSMTFNGQPIEAFRPERLMPLESRKLVVDDETHGKIMRWGDGFLKALQYDFPVLDYVSYDLDYNFGNGVVDNSNTDIHTDDTMRILASIATHPDFETGTQFFRNMPAEFVNSMKTLAELGLAIRDGQVVSVADDLPIETVEFSQAQSGQVAIFNRTPHAAPIIPVGCVRLVYQFTE